MTRMTQKLSSTCFHSASHSSDDIPRPRDILSGQNHYTDQNAASCVHNDHAESFHLLNPVFVFLPESGDDRSLTFAPEAWFYPGLQRICTRLGWAQVL